MSIIIRLRTGEEMEVRVLEPPLGEYAQRVEYWWSIIKDRLLAGEFADKSLDRFVIGEIGGEVVGSMTYATPRDTRDVAVLGMVYTVPAHRRKGIALAILRVLLELFESEGGLAMHLCTVNPHAFSLYRKAGFRPYTGDGMVWFAPSAANFDRTYLSYNGPATVRDAHYGDLARFAFLYNSPQIKWFVKDYPRRVFRDVRLESHFVQMLQSAEQEKGAVLALVAPNRRVVGAATLTEMDSLYEQHVKILDFCVAPAYLGQASHLLRAVIERAGALATEILQAYTASSDLQKRDALADAGFELEAVLRGHFAVNEERLDMEVWTMHLGRKKARWDSSRYYGGKPSYLLEKGDEL